MKVGFIGLGIMGGGMAMNVRRSGHDLVVHDLRRALAEPLLAAGATWADTVGDVGRVADVVLTSLPGPREMESVGLGSAGLLETMRAGSVWFDLTTNSPTVLRRVGERFAAKGIELLDAPVSGGPTGARSGKLALYIGGQQSTFERHRKLLDAIGDQAMYVGPLASGTAAKLAHNCASFTIRMAVAEIFTLGVKAGVEPAALWHAIRMGASGRSRTFDRIGDQFLQNRYDPPAFALRLAHKDMTLALEMAREVGVPMRMADLAYEDMTAAMERGWGELDSRSPMQLQKERAGVEFQLTAEEVRRTLARD